MTGFTHNSACPLVSIVLPTYNRAQFLPEAIESCITQTLDDWELIIVDDASTDSSREIATDYARKDPRIRVLAHSVNRKLPAALNTGFRCASGEFHTWLANDDAYTPNALQRMSAELLARKDIDLVYTDHFRFTVNQSESTRRRVEEIDKLWICNCIGSSFLYRKRVFDKLGGYCETRFMVEDYDFWLRAASAGFCFCCLHEPLHYTRLHGHSLTEEHRPHIERLSDALLEESVQESRVVTAPQRAQTYVTLAKRHWLRGEWSKCAQLVVRGFWQSPRGVLAVGTRVATRTLFQEEKG
jgi:glycosyltransferase involved in cell wall biosynthesis